MTWLGNLDFGTTVFFGFTTVDATGAPAAFSSGAITVYRNLSTVPDASGLTLVSSFNEVTGLNRVQVDLSTAFFYSSAGSYMSVITSGGAGGEDLSGYILGEWTIKGRFVGLESSAGLETLSSAGLETLSSAGLETLSSAGLETLSSAGLETLSSAGLETLSSAGLETATGFSTHSTAGLETISSAVVVASASSALEAANLDHLLLVAGSSDQVTDNSLWSRLVSTSTSYTTYDSSLDSLAGIRAAITASTDVNVVEWAGSTVIGTAGGPSTAGLETASGFSTHSTAGLETLSSAGLETLSSAGLETLSSVGLETLSSAGLETLSSAGLETISTAAVLATVSSALQDVAYEEPSFVSGGPTTAPSIALMLRYIYSGLRNQLTVSSSAKVFHNDAAGILWGKVLSEDSTEATGVYTEAGGTTST